MADPKFTPGPLVVVGRQDCEQVGNFLAVARDCGDGSTSLPTAYVATADDAALYAAAPAMYEALQKASAAFRTGQPQIVGDDTVYPLDGGLVGNALNAIRAALSSAEGREP